ncbi:MAG: M24 family metallopeptidase [Candidatus Heimdallarchaeaceae archaeon]
MKPLNYLDRIKKVQREMEEQNLDVALITPSINFGYLFKGFFEMKERLICAVLNQDDDPLLITPSFEKERMAFTSNIDNIIGWQEEENPFLKLKEAVGFEPKNIALEPTTRFETFLNFKKVFPEAKFSNLGGILNDLRSQKTEAEIQRMERAAEITVKAINQILTDLKPGITEIELLKQLTEIMTEMSQEPSWALVQFDENSAIPHGSASKKKLTEESVILIDTGTSCDHYFSDITITTTFGKPSNEFLRIYDIVQRANDAALEKSKEGVPAEEVDFAARKVIEKAGYGQYFTHRLGHGLGLEVHEEPYIVKGNKEKLVSGNVHTDEPGIYIPGKFGIRIEDDVIVEKHAAKRIFAFDRYFWEK